MKRKTLAMLLAGALSLSLLAGCGNKTTDNPGSNDNPGTTNTDNAGGSGEVTDITLKVWCPSNQIDTGIMEEQQKAFQAEHPEWNITWDTTAVGEDTCQENVLRDVEAAADVYFFASDQLPDLVNAGAIAQLGGATAEMVENNMGEAVVNTAKVDGKLYAIPFTHNTFFMFYDKTLLNEDQIKSIEGIMAAETPDNAYNFYFESAGGWKLGAWYYGAGLSVFGSDGSDLSAGVDWNNATGMAVTNYLIDLINNPKCAYDGEIAVSELIGDHRLGAWWDGSWNYDTYHDVLGDDMGLAVIPTFNPDGTDHQLLSFYGSKCIGVNAKSKNRAAAVAFAAFLGNEENQVLRYEKSAQIPTNVNAAASEAVKADVMATVISDESTNCSVMQPVNTTFSARYWTYAGAIPTEIRSGAINKDNAQEKMDAFVAAMTAE
ncbi:MAG: extracellular solute-binding protein [Clostridiales bacterium]|nr:extracellular solute-binding protein [Clostridiales bacterium]